MYVTCVRYGNILIDEDDVHDAGRVGARETGHQTALPLHVPFVLGLPTGTLMVPRGSKGSCNIARLGDFAAGTRAAPER